MFYCRYMWVKDENFRKRYLTQRVQTTLNRPKLLAMPAGTKRLQSEGIQVWKEGLTDDEKNTVRDEYARWKIQQTVKGIPNPLEIENGGNPAPLEIENGGNPAPLRDPVEIGYY
jgi:hypothetical protein